MAHSSNKQLVHLLRRFPAEALARLYERHGVAPSAGPNCLVAAIRRDGGNSIANAFRGSGVAYDEVVTDVARRMKLATSGTRAAVEFRILKHVVASYMAGASASQREQLAALLNTCASDFNRMWPLLNKAAFAASIQLVGRQVIAAVVRRALTLASVRTTAAQAAATSVRVAGATVPFLNLAFGAWFAIEIAGPAFRRTVPTVIEIALLRLETGSD